MSFSEEAKDKALEEIKREIKEGGKDEVKIISIGELLSTEFPPNKWMIEKLIPDQGISIIASVPGNFKTWLILLMARCIARGEKFLDLFQCKQANVLMVDEENMLSLLKDRSLLLEITKDLPIYFCHQKGVLISQDKWVEKIINICRKKKIGVIFFDSFVRIHDAEENSAVEISKLFRQIKRFCQEGMTVILTHHERKEGANKGNAKNRLRGSSDILAAVDCHIAIRRKAGEKKLIIEQPKLRTDEEIEKFEITFEKSENKMEFRYLGIHSEQDLKKEQSKEIIINILGENKTGLLKGEIEKQVKIEAEIGERITRLALKELIEEGEVIEKSAGKNKKVCMLSIYSSEKR